ncbi:CDP-glycerol glycerophosphotransferase family protein [Desulfonatronum thiodismutans]|uniref:CDP-glycerol glycerophosphotransferase family protein n=1 Tax=Desulfonatronum thiodismutans TaxID=159290 RepID=UPI0004ABE6D2|nr:CDP-glycerol glycerophosphotransferase family protein [Desulfonatronum thiodismutans]
MDFATIADATDVDLLFYAERSLHLSFLEPIHDYFQKRYPELRLAFSAPDFQAPREDMPGWGVEAATVSRLRQKTLFLSSTQAVRPRVSVVADACHFNLPRHGKVVNVGHGLICKGMYYRRDPVVRRENLSDLLCVPGPWHKRRLQDNVFSPIRVTGFIKSDRLFSPQAMGKRGFCAKHDLDPGKPMVLFAPTFNPELSAIPHVWDKVTTLGDDQTTIGVKLHHMTPEPWKELYRRLAAQRDDVVFLSDADYSGMMHAADVMVSDVSSMFVEFMLLNKPVVLFNSPQLESFENYDPSDLEHKVRDAVLEADSVGALRKKVDKALDQPEILEEERLQYIEELDYGRDGKSVQRAAEAIRELLTRPRKTRSRPKYSVLLELDQTADSFAERESISEVLAKSEDLPMELLPVKVPAGAASHGGFGIGREKSVLGGHRLAQACAAAKGEWVVLVQPGWVLPKQWLKWMENHFLWHRHVGMVKVLADSKQVRRVYDLLFPDRLFISDNEELAWSFRNFGIGSAAFNDRIPSPCVMLPKVAALALAKRYSEGESFSGFIRNADDGLISAGYLSATALETYVHTV